MEPVMINLEEEIYSTEVQQEISEINVWPA